MKGDIHYIDCGDSIWISKKDWETLKRWFKDNPGGLELEEYNRQPTVDVKVKTRRAK